MVLPPWRQGSWCGPLAGWCGCRWSALDQLDRDGLAGFIQRKSDDADTSFKGNQNRQHTGLGDYQTHEPMRHIRRLAVDVKDRGQDTAIRRHFRADRDIVVI